MFSKSFNLKSKFSNKIYDQLLILKEGYEVDFKDMLYWENSPDWKIDWRTISTFFILMPIESSVLLETDRGKKVLKCGTYCLLAPYTKHKLTHLHPSKTLKQLTFHCNIEDDFGRPLDLSKLPTTFTENVNEDFINNWMKMISLFNQHRKLCYEVAYSFLISRFTYILKRHSDWNIGSHCIVDKRIAETLQYIQEDLSQIFHIPSLAERIGLKDVQFRRLFKKELGVAPLPYIINLRLNRACELLKNSNLTIKEIAYQCGFETDQYFHLTFKKHIQMRPSEYRNTSRIKF